MPNMKPNLPLEDNRLEGHKKKAKRRYIPFERIREMAKKSSEGGRGRCYFCKEHFSMTYLSMRTVALFTEALVCRDCKHERHL